MHDPATDKSRSGMWISLLAAAPLLYVLSCAPVVELMEDPSLPRRWPDWVYTLYEPVSWLYEIPQLDVLLANYHDWWRERL